MLSGKRLARKFLASFFNVGDVVLYGRWKNKKAKIIAFGQDAHGNPTVTIEPIPKGRKKNRTFSLFKIWKAPIDKQASAMNQTVLVARVVNAWHRYARENINVGETFEKDNLRIHRYRDHFRITDTTNAGKRGKRVKTMLLSLKKWTSSEELYSWLNNIGGLLAELGSYQEVVRLMKDVSVDYPGEIDMSESEERGVDVTPAGFVELKIRGDHVYVEVGYKDFTVKNLDDQANEPTCIPAIKGGIKAIPVFYRWVRDNQSKINNMKYLDVLNAMKDLDVPYHDYCAMD